MTKILVTGSNGQVGQELQGLAAEFSSFHFFFTDYDTLDITDAEAVGEIFNDEAFNYCINCAAYTAVDKAESDSETAKRINVIGTANLAANCATHHTHLIQISTDYVYHTQQNTPFRENDATNPQSVYASTKLYGDAVAMQVNHLTTVIRTSWVYSTFGHNFVKTMLRLGNERDSLNVVFDQIGSPTYAYDLAGAILNIIQKMEDKKVTTEQSIGIFHYSNEGVTSWYDFAKAIFDLNQINIKVNPIETSDFPTPAKRPPFSLLNKQKIKTVFGLNIPYWRDSLAACLKKL